MATTLAKPRLTASRKAGNTLVLRATSGALIASETTTAVDCSYYDVATLVISITDMLIQDTGNELDFYFQTTYDDETTWTDLENIHYDSTDSTTDTITRIVTIGPPLLTATTTIAVANLDGAITDDNKDALPLGSKIRIKVIATGLTTGEYFDYSCIGYFR